MDTNHQSSFYTATSRACARACVAGKPISGNATEFSQCRYTLTGQRWLLAFLFCVFFSVGNIFTQQTRRVCYDLHLKQLLVFYFICTSCLIKGFVSNLFLNILPILLIRLSLLQLLFRFLSVLQFYQCKYVWILLAREVYYGRESVIRTNWVRRKFEYSEIRILELQIRNIQ